MLVGVESEAPQNAFSLEQNYPNPVQDATAFYFTLNTAANVRLTLTDLAGKEIFTLAEGLFPAGRHKAEAAGELISNLASGSYYYQLRAGRDVLTRLMTVVK
jgi:hypothetical protein